jgi:hypothetical protein
MSALRSGFPVSGSQGMGNRETASKSLNLIQLPFPDEVGRRTPIGKPIKCRPADDCGDARQNRGPDSRLMLPWMEAMVSVFQGRAADLPAGNGGTRVVTPV